MPPDRSPTVAVIGGYLTANKGGAAMTLAVLRHVVDQGGSVRLLTIYPGPDRAEVERTSLGAVEVVAWTPRRLLLHLPVALLIALLRLARVPRGPAARVGGIRALSDADLVVDVAGISFVDGRGIALLGYNVLMTGIPLLVGTPVVKASQASGPFRRPLNRLAARAVLGRVRVLCARGAGTRRHLDELGVANVVDAADLAFSLPDPGDAERAAAQACSGSGPFVCVMPSAVVERYCAGKGIDYVGTLAELVRTAIEGGRSVLVAAHSVEPQGRPGRMHDVPVCDALVAAVCDPRCRRVDAELGPEELRALIAAADALVTSRFHAMVSGLSTVTPTLVMGWSHKYAEVLAAFGLERWCIDHSELAGERPIAMLQELLGPGGDDVRSAIRAGLPAVVVSSRRSLDEIDACLEAAR